MPKQKAKERITAHMERNRVKVTSGRWITNYINKTKINLRLVHLEYNELFPFHISVIQDQVEEVQPASRQSQKSAPPTPVEALPKPLPVPPTWAESPPPAQNHRSDRTFEARRGFIEHGKFL